MGFVRDFSDSIRLGFAKMLASQDVEVTDFGEVVDSKKMVEEANLSADQINMLKAAMQNSDTAGKDMNKKQAGSVVLHASDMVINARTKLGFLLKKGKANRRLREKLEGADIFVTGEGRIDAQSVMGKAPVSAARIAKEAGATTLAFCAVTGDGAEAVNEEGIDAFFPILREICDKEQMMQKENAALALAQSAEQVFRAMNSVK